MNSWDDNIAMEKVTNVWATRILGSHFFERASLEQDMHEATDIILSNKGLKLPETRFGVRFRRHKFYNGVFKEQFTLTTSAPSGIKCEYEKVMEGFMDYFLYGFASEDYKSIVKWFIGDMNVFREHIPTLTANPSDYTNDKDGFKFKVFDKSMFPLNFIVAEWGK